MGTSCGFFFFGCCSNPWLPLASIGWYSFRPWNSRTVMWIQALRHSCLKVQGRSLAKLRCNNWRHTWTLQPNLSVTYILIDSPPPPLQDSFAEGLSWPIHFNWPDMRGIMHVCDIHTLVSWHTHARAHTVNCTTRHFIKVCMQQSLLHKNKTKKTIITQV